MEKASKKKSLMIGVCLATALGLSGCSDQPEEPTVSGCNDLDWDQDTETWVCDDESSSHYRHYYYGNGFYSNKSALKSNSSYKSYMSKGGSGFGKGSGSFGG